MNCSGGGGALPVDIGLGGLAGIVASGLTMPGVNAGGASALPPTLSDRMGILPSDTPVSTIPSGILIPDPSQQHQQQVRVESVNNSGQQQQNQQQTSIGSTSFPAPSSSSDNNNNINNNMAAAQQQGGLAAAAAAVGINPGQFALIQQMMTIQAATNGGNANVGAGNMIQQLLMGMQQQGDAGGAMGGSPQVNAEENSSKE